MIGASKMETRSERRKNLSKAMILVVIGVVVTAGVFSVGPIAQVGRSASSCAPLSFYSRSLLERTAHEATPMPPNHRCTQTLHAGHVFELD
jgi:hypothetical protein